MRDVAAGVTFSSEHDASAKQLELLVWDTYEIADCCWLASVIIGGLALTLVYMFAVVPLKSGTLPSNMGGLFIIGFLLNAAWGFGWALWARSDDRGYQSSTGSSRPQTLGQARPGKGLNSREKGE
jgi:hypothetical protein